MRRIIIAAAALVLVTAGAVVWVIASLNNAAASPLVGTWKVTVLEQGVEASLWLVQIEEKDGKLQGVEMTEGEAKHPLEDFKVDDQAVRFTIKGDSRHPIVAYLSKEGGAKKLLGSAEFSGQRVMMQLERTELKKLDRDKAIVRGPAAEAFERAANADTPKAQAAAFKGILEKYAGQPVAFDVSLVLIELAPEIEAPEADIKVWSEQALKLAGPYGKEMEMQANLALGQALAGSEKQLPLALDHARKAESMLTNSSSPAARVAVYRALLTVLEKAGKRDDVKKAEEQLEMAEDGLIEVKPLPERKGDQRVVLVELFTGVQCPPCVAADFAFDALVRTAKPNQAVLLQYHEHIPGPDPLTNADSEARAEFYGLEGTPGVYINGKEGPPLGGGIPQAPGRYEKLRQAVEAQLSVEPQAKLKLTVSRKGEQLDLQAEVSDLAKTGEDIRLRFVLTEDMARFPGRNGQRFHHHVVRGFPGGVQGFPLKDATGKQTATIKVDEVRKSLQTYVDDFFKGRKPPADGWPLELKNLKVVVFVQNDKSKAVLQAAQVDVPKAEGK